MSDPGPGEVSHGRAADVAGRGTLWLFGARLFFLLGGLAISILLARLLGPEDFGLYGLGMALLTWTQLPIGSSMSGAVARLAPRYDYDPRIIGTASVLLIGGAILLYLAIWVMAPFLEALTGQPGTAAVVRLLSLDLLLLAGLAVWQCLFLTHGRLFWLAVPLTVQTGVKLAGVLLLALLGAADLWGVIVAHLAASVVALAIVAAFHRPPRPAFDGERARVLLLGSSLLSLYMLLYQFQGNVGVWWVAAVGSAEETGDFAAATQVARVMTVVPAVLSSVLFARIAEAMARGARAEAAGELATAVRYALMLLLPAVAALFAGADRIVALLYGEAYAPAADMLRLLGVAGAAMALLDVLLNALMGSGWSWIGPLVAGLVMPVAFVSGLVLVPWLGASGVASALALGALVALATALGIVHCRLGAPLRPISLGRLGIAAILLYLVLERWTVPLAWLLPQFGLLALGYFACLWLLRELDQRDLALFRPALRTRGAV